MLKPRDDWSTIAIRFDSRMTESRVAERRPPGEVGSPSCPVHVADRDQITSRKRRQFAPEPRDRSRHRDRSIDLRKALEAAGVLDVTGGTRQCAAALLIPFDLWSRQRYQD
jgi:hypothetical protein